MAGRTIEKSSDKSGSETKRLLRKNKFDEETEHPLKNIADDISRKSPLFKQVERFFEHVWNSTRLTLDEKRQIFRSTDNIVTDLVAFRGDNAGMKAVSNFVDTLMSIPSNNKDYQEPLADIVEAAQDFSYALKDNLSDKALKYAFEKFTELIKDFKANDDISKSEVAEASARVAETIPEPSKIFDVISYYTLKYNRNGD